jgi:hypothetical protein
MGLPHLATVRSFLRNAVRPDLPKEGAWDNGVASALQESILALQMHSVWGDGCAARPDHIPGVYTPGFAAHLRFLIAQRPREEEGAQELLRFINALDALGVGLLGPETAGR